MSDLSIASILRPVLTLFVAIVAVLAMPAIAQAGPTGGISGNGETTEGETKAPSGSEAKYTRIWMEKVSARDKRWAHETAICESGKDPKAIAPGGQYRGAFQFLLSTWKNSPKSPGGDPIDYSYRTQAVVAVLLKKEMGSSPWPVCG